MFPPINLQVEIESVGVTPSSEKRLGVKEKGENFPALVVGSRIVYQNSVV